MNIPQHVAIIMDGNGRWAKQRGLSRSQGHKEGVKRVEEVIEASRAMGVKVLTLFTFSTENWNRPKIEISLLMGLLSEALNRKVNKLMAADVRFQTIGKQDKIPNSLKNVMDEVIEKTKHNTSMVLNLAFDYGGQQEIVDAIKVIATDVKEGRCSVEDIDQAMVKSHLYTNDIIDPDLLIRTSGEKRISNFLLWQLSYAELYFTDVLWPDFTPDEFSKAIADFQKRERRFGALNIKGSQ